MYEVFIFVSFLAMAFGPAIVASFYGIKPSPRQV